MLNLIYEYLFSCMCLTPDFLIMGTDMGGIAYFYVEDWCTVTSFKHITGKTFLGIDGMHEIFFLHNS